MASTIMGAVYQRFENEITLADGSGGVWFNEIPEEKSAFPFVAIFDEGTAPEFQSGADYIERTRFHFDVYAVGLSACGVVVEQIKTAFDLPATSDADAAFVVDWGRAIACYRTRQVMEAVGERSNTGEMVFHGSVSFELMTQKALQS